MKKNYKKSLVVILVFVFLLALTFIFKDNIVQFMQGGASLKEYILSWGMLAPLALILLNFIQVLLAPIPGQPFVIAGGYIFGVYLGALYSLIGMTAAAIIAFKIGKKYGKPLITKWFGKKNVDKVDNIPQKHLLIFLFLVFILPFFPDDLIIFLAGMTGLSLGSFMVVFFLSRIPSTLGYSFIGAGIADVNLTLVIGFVAGICFLLALAYLFRDWIEEKIMGIK